MVDVENRKETINMINKLGLTIDDLLALKV